MSSPSNNWQTRGAPRYDVQVPIAYCALGFRGRGEIENLSSLGALVAGYRPPLAPGSPVDLIVARHAEGRLISLPGTVVRMDESSFAVEFANVGLIGKVALDSLVDEAKEAS